MTSRANSSCRKKIRDISTRKKENWEQPNSMLDSIQRDKGFQYSEILLWTLKIEICLFFYIKNKIGITCVIINYFFLIPLTYDLVIFISVWVADWMISDSDQVSGWVETSQVTGRRNMFSELESVWGSRNIFSSGSVRAVGGPQIDLGL